MASVNPRQFKLIVKVRTVEFKSTFPKSQSQVESRFFIKCNYNGHNSISDANNDNNNDNSNNNDNNSINDYDNNINDNNYNNNNYNNNNSKNNGDNIFRCALASL